MAKHKPIVETVHDCSDLEVRSDAYLAGFDPEMADMDNPRGEYYGEEYFILISSPYGTRFRHKQTFCTYDRKGFRQYRTDGKSAETLAKEFMLRINLHLKRGGRLDARGWVEHDPIYGSQAYQDFGIEARNAREEREQDERDNQYIG